MSNNASTPQLAKLCSPPPKAPASPSPHRLSIYLVYARKVDSSAPKNSFIQPFRSSPLAPPGSTGAQRSSGSGLKFVSNPRLLDRRATQIPLPENVSWERRCACIIATPPQYRKKLEAILQGKKKAKWYDGFGRIKLSFLLDAFAILRDPVETRKLRAIALRARQARDDEDKKFIALWKAEQQDHYEESLVLEQSQESSNPDAIAHIHNKKDTTSRSFAGMFYERWTLDERAIKEKRERVAERKIAKQRQDSDFMKKELFKSYHNIHPPSLRISVINADWHAKKKLLQKGAWGTPQDKSIPVRDKEESTHTDTRSFTTSRAMEERNQPTSSKHPKLVAYSSTSLQEY